MAYISRSLNNAERNYGASERETLAIHWACQELRVYLGDEFIVRTDHQPLQWVLQNARGKQKNKRLERWAAELQEYRFTIRYKPGKQLLGPDGLSRLPSREDAKDAIQKQHKALASGAGAPLLRAFAQKAKESLRELERIAHEGKAEQPEVIRIGAITMQEYLGQKAAALKLPTQEELLEAQRGDEHCAAMMRAVELDIAPGDLSGKHLTSFVREVGRHFVHPKTGVLHRTVTPSGQNLEAGARIVLPANLTKQIIIAFHDTQVAGHMGPEKTRRRIESRFYWKSLRADVDNHCAKCGTCTFVKKFKQEKAGLLNPYLAQYPFDTVHIDIINGLPVTKEGHKAILVMIDKFSKWPELVALKDTESLTVWRAVRDTLITRYGIPHRLVSDNGSQFLSDIVTRLSATLGIQQINTTPYHPLSTAQAERLNWSIVVGLKPLCPSIGTSWADNLQWVAFAYRTAVHKATGITPYSTLFGREAQFPADVIYQRPLTEAKTDPSGYRKRIAAILDRAWKYAAITNAEAAVAYKKYFDKGQKDREYTVGQLVLLYREPKTVGEKKRKLALRWSGPWRIVRKTSAESYTIEYANPLVEGGRKTETAAHTTLLIPYPEQPELMLADPVEDLVAAEAQKAEQAEKADEPLPVPDEPQAVPVVPEAAEVGHEDVLLDPVVTGPVDDQRAVGGSLEALSESLVARAALPVEEPQVPRTAPDRQSVVDSSATSVEEAANPRVSLSAARTEPASEDDANMRALTETHTKPKEVRGSLQRPQKRRSEAQPADVRLLRAAVEPREEGSKRKKPKDARPRKAEPKWKTERERRPGRRNRPIKEQELAPSARAGQQERESIEHTDRVEMSLDDKGRVLVRVGHDWMPAKDWVGQDAARMTLLEEHLGKSDGPRRSSKRSRMPLRED